ncbi:MAG: hypothetical protein HYT08_00275 [Candidatus Levybacteria bacterium]|nr:hypothetical protein [Candidatus Levybacteria bacterium]
MELIFVYNADSGFFNSIKDLIHKSVSPKTYGCNLCGLTFSGASMKQEWREFLDSLPIRATFLHKDEFTKQYPKYAMITYPVVFKKENGILKGFIYTDEINQQKTLETLQKLVRDKMQAHESRA